MAIGNSVGDEIREERRKAMGRMSPKEKFAYFWDYYKIHAFVTVAVIIAGFLTLVNRIIWQKPHNCGFFYVKFIKF